MKLELAALLNLVLHCSSEDLQNNDKEKGESVGLLWSLVLFDPV